MRDITTGTTVPVPVTTPPFAHLVRARGNRPRRKKPPGIQFPFRQTLRPFLRAQRQARPAGGLFSEPPCPFAGLFQPGVCQTTRTGSCENIPKINSVKPEARLFPRTREGGLSSSPPLFSLFLLFFISSWFFFFFSFPLFLFSLTKAHEGAHPALPGKTGRAGCEAAVRQLPLATGRATMPAYSRGNSTIEKNNATCQRATNREHTTKTKNRAPATFGAT